eukprot:CAMPEP_0202921232 /NCGR_PEP_ID=MMETSP1392-20130828/77282_1 /ASSEMBLY_ACC=CAM_ASM_000868 /TAXON_ID=225041 /ORGANISM="Chlamydomonas chlamydogama, Strain SAG 11-48b" /LENGTH=81 /DNA_ID=CAMNT_0049614785 /DNA_START=728 /DNA_END=973 /DNA_ORIENTATION=+
MCLRVPVCVLSAEDEVGVAEGVASAHLSAASPSNGAGGRYVECNMPKSWVARDESVLERVPEQELVISSGCRGECTATRLA